MKSKLIGLALFALTAAIVVFYPYFEGNAVTGNIAPPAIPFTSQPQIEVVFALDTTGSMGGLIHAAKEKIWSIATTMASAQHAPEIRMGLVAYRDRGDAYVTKLIDLSDDLDSMYAQLMDFEAAGGGDGPESVNQALYDAIHGISWSQDEQSYKVVFLVGDAPPHMDYADDVKYPEILSAARRKGIIVNTIQCGEVDATLGPWQRIARLGDGDYFRVEQSGSAVAYATPFDESLARLSEELDATKLYYGEPEKKELMQKKKAATAKLHAESSTASRARRAAFNATPSGAKNLLGEGELVADIEQGRVDLSAIDKDELPASMQAMSPEEQKAFVETTAERRSGLLRQIEELTVQRKDFLEKKVDEAGGRDDSLDQKLYDAIREQAADKGLEYDGGPEY